MLIPVVYTERCQGEQAMVSLMRMSGKTKRPSIQALQGV